MSWKSESGGAVGSLRCARWTNAGLKWTGCEVSVDESAMATAGPYAMLEMSERASERAMAAEWGRRGEGERPSLDAIELG